MGLSDKGGEVIRRRCHLEEAILSQPVIEIVDLTVAIDDRKIFSGLNLEVQALEKVSLVGRSGSGKSTLLRCLLGFVVPTAGKIKIFGEDVTAKSIWKLRTRMAYVPQEPELSNGSVTEILAKAFTFGHNRALRDNLQLVPELMERLLLPETLMDEDISELSGGEKQRIAMLMALLLERDIMLLDEASSALDPESKRATIRLLKEQQDLTLLSVSHDQEWLAISDRTVDLAMLRKGEGE